MDLKAKRRAKIARKRAKMKRVESGRKTAGVKPRYTPDFVLKICKRDMYSQAWKWMWENDKTSFKRPEFDGVNPALNRTALATETDNWCVVVFDRRCHTEEFDLGKPVGLFSFVITSTRGGAVKPIGKQWVVHPDYHGKGLGKAMLLALELKMLKEGYTWYYIGCSSMSTRVMRSCGYEPYDENAEHDLNKFKVTMDAHAIQARMDAHQAKHDDFVVIGL